MKLVVFYSWQSDRDFKLCRNFIEIALSAAAERLKARRGIEVVVDSDTKDVPGTPPISDTILKKIDACDVFLADMTFVAATAEGKLSPNPNVMGEYVYALKAKGWPNILLVMNAAFGAPGDLPFDLHHLRHPLSYSVATVKPDAARRVSRLPPNS